MESRNVHYKFTVISLLVAFVSRQPRWQPRADHKGVFRPHCSRSSSVGHLAPSLDQIAVREGTGGALCGVLALIAHAGYQGGCTRPPFR